MSKEESSSIDVAAVFDVDATTTTGVIEMSLSSNAIDNNNNNNNNGENSKGGVLLLGVEEEEQPSVSPTTMMKAEYDGVIIASLLLDVKSIKVDPPEEETTKSAELLQLPLWLLCDKYKAEAMLRIIICVSLGSILTINDSMEEYKFIPHNSRYFIGWFASFLPIFYPKLVFAIMGMMPYDSTMMIFSCLITSFFFLICENYGRGWMTVAYSVDVLLMTTLFFGDTYQKTSGVSIIYGNDLQYCFFLLSISIFLLSLMFECSLLLFVTSCI
jgi:hypothetical protein